MNNGQTLEAFTAMLQPCEYTEWAIEEIYGYYTDLERFENQLHESDELIENSITRDDVIGLWVELDSFDSIRERFGYTLDDSEEYILQDLEDSQNVYYIDEDAGWIVTTTF